MLMLIYVRVRQVVHRIFFGAAKPPPVHSNLHQYGLMIGSTVLFVVTGCILEMETTRTTIAQAVLRTSVFGMINLLTLVIMRSWCTHHTSAPAMASTPATTAVSSAHVIVMQQTHGLSEYVSWLIGIVCSLFCIAICWELHKWIDTCQMVTTALRCPVPNNTANAHVPPIRDSASASAEQPPSSTPSSSAHTTTQAHALAVR